MKPLLVSIAAAVLLGSSVFAAAETVPRPQRSADSKKSNTPPAPPPPPRPTLSANYQITIAGSIENSEPFEITLVGNGNLRANLDFLVGSFVEIKPENEKEPLKFSYRIVMSPPSNQPGAEVRSSIMEGSFVAVLGQSIPVLQTGQSKLTIRVDKYPEGRAP